MKQLSFLLPFVISLFFSTHSWAQDDQVVNRLYELPDVVFSAGKGIGAGQAFELRIKQPLDHDNPNKGYFYQRVFLLHRSASAPTVIVTEGYNIRRHTEYEVTKLLEANQLQVEHRFFGGSMPDTVDYRYLNLKQVTADYHHIKEIFAELYTGKWISTGISKGGATTIFYRFFFPEDTQVGVPYVAPINDEFEEDRIYTFLDTIGTETCRAGILEVQKAILRRRDEVLPRIKYFAKGANAQFSYLDFEQAFEFSVLEYPFSFWQTGADCQQIPAPDAPIDTLLEHFLSVSDVTFFADGAMRDYASHYYQSAEEFGYYGYETEELTGLLNTFAPGVRPHATFTPNHMKVEFKPEPLNNLNKWLKKGADHMIYIYGANDTWSASAVQPNSRVDSRWFFLKGRSHFDARIRTMSPSEKRELIGALEQWLALDIAE